MNISEYEASVTSFAAYLRAQERAASTVTQYVREVRLFAVWMAEGGVKQETGDASAEPEEQSGRRGTGLAGAGIICRAAGPEGTDAETGFPQDDAGLTLTRDAVIAYKHHL